MPSPARSAAPRRATNSPCRATRQMRTNGRSRVTRARYRREEELRRGDLAASEPSNDTVEFEARRDAAIGIHFAREGRLQVIREIELNPHGGGLRGADILSIGLPMTHAAPIANTLGCFA